jgi:N-acetyl-alpha-D-glucosaminyl L-malate synthase BshA
MRIGIVCYPTVGGSGVVATEMAHALAPARSRRPPAQLRPPEPPAPRHPRPAFHQVAVSAYPLFRYPPYDLALATRMLEVREEARVDLFHVHYAIPHAVSAFLARSMCGGCLKFVTTLHGTDITVVGSDRAYMRPTRFAFEQSDAVTAVSKYLADETHLVFGVRKDRRGDAQLRRHRPLQADRSPPWHQRPDQRAVLVHASNFRPVKRIADVVRAFAAILRKVPARLLLVGDGPDREHAMAVAADLGCQHKVEYLGMQDHLEDQLPQADLFLSASETESFGLSMLEAMSCGVPCVSTAVGGVSEVLGDTGRLVPFGDPRRWPARHCRSAAGPGDLHAVGAAPRATRRRPLRDRAHRRPVRAALRTRAAVSRAVGRRHQRLLRPQRRRPRDAAEVLACFVDVERDCPGNPASSHTPGSARAGRSRGSARTHRERPRRRGLTDVLFTSGGTEAANLAVLGLGDPNLPVVLGEDRASGRVRTGRARPVPLAVDAGGAQVVRARSPSRPLCLVHAQSELGTLQPVAWCRGWPPGLRVPCSSTPRRRSAACRSHGVQTA